MNAGNANLLNSVVLVGMGLWGYMSSETPSPTALIPVVFGAALFVMTNFIRNNHKIVSHIAVVLTLICLLGLAMPFKGAIGRSDTMAMVRVGVMIITSIIAMVAFIKSFKEARKAKG